ncbi:Metallo-hydrolase/oxidoreductase [Lactarius psammicola]|nr:Metallo-hydrolase/oxidoreductase [Lactarius psammicola]
MRVVPVPVRKDNYAYLLVDDTVNEAAAVDSYTPSKVKAAAEQLGVKVIAGITTHHHNDHSGGNEARLFPGVPIYGGSHKSPALTHLVGDSDRFTVGKALDVRCLATPCHTRDSICYYVTDASSLRCRRGGCGMFFEGTGAEMHAAFELLRAALPDDTVTYVGHEYTAGNLRFARSVDPGNAGLARLAAIVDAHPITVGRTTIGDEKEWNVFWRLTSDPVQNATKTGPDTPPSEIMDKLRTLKNNFKG